MNKLLKTLATPFAPRLHALAPALHGAPFGMAPTMGDGWHRAAQVVARTVDSACAGIQSSIQAFHAGQPRSLYDEQIRQADARMADLMAQTRAI